MVPFPASVANSFKSYFRNYLSTFLPSETEVREVTVPFQVMIFTSRIPLTCLKNSSLVIESQ